MSRYSSALPFAGLALVGSRQGLPRGRLRRDWLARHLPPKFEGGARRSRSKKVDVSRNHVDQEIVKADYERDAGGDPHLGQGDQAGNPADWRRAVRKPGADAGTSRFRPGRAVRSTALPTR